MKIPAQEKIAELEGRIVVLESEVRRLKLRHTVYTRTMGRSLWQKFDEVFKKFD